MTYDFSSLSHNEFEDLARDLVGREIELRFEALTTGWTEPCTCRRICRDAGEALPRLRFRGVEVEDDEGAAIDRPAGADALHPRDVCATYAKEQERVSRDHRPIAANAGRHFRTRRPQYPVAQISRHREGPSKALGAEHFGSANGYHRSFGKALSKPEAIPTVLANLLPPTVETENPASTVKKARDTIFLIKASPIDDEFALWLAPRLEAEGYRIFADILTLQPGDRWRRQINQALQYQAAKVLLFCRDATVSDAHVQDDLDLALELAEELGDSRFIIPLRLEPGKKVKGVGDAVTVDFMRGWGEGVGLLLDALQRQKVPRSAGELVINPNWEIFRRRGAIPLVEGSRAIDLELVARRRSTRCHPIFREHRRDRGKTA